MSRIAAITILALVPLAGGCGHRGSDFLLESEFDFLAEDVIDLMTITFHVGENAFLGDPVFAEDIIEEGGAGNNFTAIYDLPQADRIGIGAGFGRASVRITEDGVPTEVPLDFTFAGTSALTIVITYEVQYLGVTAGGRDTDIDFLVTATATRATTSEPFLVEYLVDGDCFLGATFCRLLTDFRAEGSPRNGLIVGFGDGSGFIDDPDVFDVFDLDIDYSFDDFVAEGNVGCCAFFDEAFLYEEVF